MSKIEIIPLNKIVPDENQPRKLFDPELLKSLKASVERYGVMNPVTVEKIGEKYLLVDGERRFRVATELKLGEIPTVIQPTQNAVDRLVRQFHLQEQHAEWTPTEKAVTVSTLARELKIPLKEVCEMLSIPKNTADRYVAFNGILDKKTYHKDNIGIEWAPKIRSVKNCVKHILGNKDEIFTKDIELKLEKAIFKRISNNELSTSDKYKGSTRLLDSFKKDDKLIDRFIDTDVTVDEMYVGSKAKLVSALRNAWVSAGYVESNIRIFLKDPCVELTPIQISGFRCAYKMIKELLDRVTD